MERLRLSPSSPVAFGTLFGMADYITQVRLRGPVSHTRSKPHILPFSNVGHGGTSESEHSIHL